MKRKLLLPTLLFCSLVFGQKDSLGLDYMRSSLATFFVDNGKLEQDAIVKNAFLSKFAPDKYNPHELPERIIQSSSGIKNEKLVAYLSDYFKTNQIAKQLVAKWFNRSKKGGFNTDLLMKRGLYNAQELDKQIAKSTVSGIEKIKDKGENLIDNTFVVVMASNYTNKEDVAKGLKAGLGFMEKLGVVNLGVASDLTHSAITTVGRGYWVKTTSYLFKLKWNEDIMHRFYNDLWVTDDKITPEKKAAFDNADFFELEYIGDTSTGADIQSTTLSTKTDSQLIERSTIKSFDKAIANLQKEYDVFSLKLPIYSISPLLTIKAGTKEGITTKSKFGIFEIQENENKKLSLVQVGKLKVDKDYPIWNNEFGADEENTDKAVDCTVLKLQSIKGDVVPGMLIIQTN